MSPIGLAGEFRKIRTGAQTTLRLCRPPVRSQVRLGPTHTGPLAEHSRENIETAIHSGLSGLAVHVVDRSTNSHRKVSSPWPTTYKTHTVASRKQLEGTRITRKSDPYSQVSEPHLQWWLEEDNILHCQPLHTPNKACSADLYRRIKRRVGHSLIRAQCKKNLVLARK